MKQVSHSSSRQQKKIYIYRERERETPPSSTLTRRLIILLSLRKSRHSMCDGAVHSKMSGMPRCSKLKKKKNRNNSK